MSFIRAAALEPSSRFFENCSLALYLSWRLTEVADGSAAAASIVAASFPGTLGRQIHVPSTFSSNTTDELEDKRVSEDIGTGEGQCVCFPLYLFFTSQTVHQNL